MNLTSLLLSAAIAVFSSTGAVTGRAAQERLSMDFSSDSQTGVSGVHDPFSSFAPSHATRALRRAIGFEVDHRIKRARLDGRTREAALYPFVGLWGLLATMTGEEQRWFKSKIWRLDECETTENMNQVLRARSLVSKLNNLGDPVDRQVFDIMQSGQLRRRQSFLVLESNLKLSAAERQQAIWRQKLKLFDAHSAVSSSLVLEPRDPLGVDSFLARVDATDLMRDIAQIKRLLSPAQIAEWNMIIRKTIEARDRIGWGRNPWDEEKPPVSPNLQRCAP